MVRAESYDAIAVAGALRPLIEKRSEEIEAARRLPADLSRELADAGLYRWWVPRAYGGLEVPLVPALEALELLARADASVAWCVFIAITSSSVLGFLPEAVARRVSARPENLISGVFAPNGRAEAAAGGFRVSGQWPFGSGTLNADWVIAGSFFYRDGEQLVWPGGAPRQHMVLVPASDVEFLDTWNVSGLCGTGSTDFRLTDVLVPEEHIVGWDGKTFEAPLYAFPQFTLLSSGFGPVALGLARSAIDDLCELAVAKTPTGSRRPLAEHPDLQVSVAKAEARYRSARAYLHEVSAAAWDAAVSGGEVSLPHRRDVRLAILHAVNESVKVVDDMYTQAGGTSLYRKSRLQRMLRDVHAVTQHVMLRRTVYETTGRAFLGIEKGTSIL